MIACFSVVEGSAAKAALLDTIMQASIIPLSNC